MRKIKIICAVFLSVVILGSAYVYGENIIKTIQVTYRNISILVNGKQVPSEQEPFIFQGRTFVPLRTIGEAVNKTVEWDNAKNQIKISDNPNNYTRLDSFSSLLNYFPDNFTMTKTDEKLSTTEANQLENFIRNIANSDIKLDSTNLVYSSYQLMNHGEARTFFRIRASKDLICIRYSDGNLYFLVSNNRIPYIIGASDGWIISFNQPYHGEPEFEYYFQDYLVMANQSLLKDKPNRTKQITDLFVSNLWFVNIGLGLE